MKRSAWVWVVFALLCVGMAGYALYTYAFLTPGAAVHPKMRITYKAHPWPISLHVFGASVAMLLAPFQLSTSLRARAPGWHRLMGRLYLTLGVGGAAALFLAPIAFGGWVSTTGFALLAAAWLLTGAMGLRSALRRDFAAHRRWMVRNVSMTFAAVTLRVLLGTSFALRLPFDSVYPLLAWLSWVPNVVVAEWLIRREGRRGSVGVSI
jgi:hypothetical protein